MSALIDKSADISYKRSITTKLMFTQENVGVCKLQSAPLNAVRPQTIFFFSPIKPDLGQNILGGLSIAFCLLQQLITISAS
jgi:hypothetical protein